MEKEFEIEGFEIYKERERFLYKCSKCGTNLWIGDFVEEYKGSILCKDCCVNPEQLFYLE